MRHTVWRGAGIGQGNCGRR